MAPPSFSAANESQRISDYIESIGKLQDRHWKHLSKVLKTAAPVEIVASSDSEAAVADNPLARSRANVFVPSSPPLQDSDESEDGN